MAVLRAPSLVRVERHFDPAPATRPSEHRCFELPVARSHGLLSVRDGNSESHLSIMGDVRAWEQGLAEAAGGVPRERHYGQLDTTEFSRCDGRARCPAGGECGSRGAKDLAPAARQD